MIETIFSQQALWFLVGAVSYKIGSALVGYGRIALFAQDVVFQSLRLLVTMTEDVSFMRQLKYLQMQKGGAAEEEVELAKVLDEQTINTWKEMVVHRFLTIYPRQLHGVIKFRTWEEALQILTKELTKRKI